MCLAVRYDTFSPVNAYATSLLAPCCDAVRYVVLNLRKCNNAIVVGQDLVAWVMAGIVHVPRSEVQYCQSCEHMCKLIARPCPP